MSVGVCVCVCARIGVSALECDLLCTRVQTDAAPGPMSTVAVLIYVGSGLYPTSPSLGDLTQLITMYSGWLPW